MNKEQIKEYTFCGEQIRKAISCDCGIFYFKGDVRKLLAQQKEEIKKVMEEMRTNEAENGFGAESLDVGYDRAIDDILNKIKEI